MVFSLWRPLAAAVGAVLLIATAHVNITATTDGYRSPGSSAVERGVLIGT